MKKIEIQFNDAFQLDCLLEFIHCDIARGRGESSISRELPILLNLLKTKDFSPRTQEDISAVIKPFAKEFSVEQILDSNARNFLKAQIGIWRAACSNW